MQRIADDDAAVRIAFTALGCILDTGSGAAISVRCILEALAAAGFDCRSFTPTIFDGAAEYALGGLTGAAAVSKLAPGETARINVEGVAHHVFRTASTVGTRVSQDELQRFATETCVRIKAFNPHVIIVYGSSQFSAALFRELRRLAGRFVFYLANENINSRDLFAAEDVVVCPSYALIALTKERFGLDARLLRDPISPRNAADPCRSLAVQAPEARANGFITFINPAPNKGAALVLALAQKASQVRPDLTFLIVESRVRKSFWDRSGLLKRDLPNVFWIPHQSDLRRVYERTSVLLFPSFWFEVSGRSIAEAQLGGIPVLASRRGGIAEQLNGGGFLFDIPEELGVRDSLMVPGENVILPWLDTICRLIDDEQSYRDASARALEAARPFRWQAQQQDIAALFREIAA